MPDRNGKAAWRAFRDPLAQVVQAVDRPNRLIERDFGDGKRMLATPPEGFEFGVLTLNFSFHLLHVTDQGGAQRMTTVRYTFSLVAADDERVFAWHWHPHSRRAKVKHPHLHIPKGSRYSTRHIPTGRMCVEDIVLFGFDELGVEPAYPTARDNVVEIRNKHIESRG